MARPYLPDCNCSTRCEGEKCPVHAPRARANESTRANKAVHDGKIARAEYDAWLEKYKKKTKKPFAYIWGSKRNG